MTMPSVGASENDSLVLRGYEELCFVIVLGISRSHVDGQNRSNQINQSINHQKYRG